MKVSKGVWGKILGGRGALKIQQHIYSHVRSKYTPAKWQVLWFQSFIHCIWFPAAQSSVIPWLLCLSRCLWREATVLVCESCGRCGQFGWSDYNRFVSALFDVRKVFFEAGAKGAPSLTDAELSAFWCNEWCMQCCTSGSWTVSWYSSGTKGHASNVGVGADVMTFGLTAWSGPWCSCGIHPINFSFIEALQPAEGGSPETPSGLFHFAPLLV